MRNAPRIRDKLVFYFILRSSPILTQPRTETIAFGKWRNETTQILKAHKIYIVPKFYLIHMGTKWVAVNPIPLWVANNVPVGRLKLGILGYMHDTLITFKRSPVAIKGFHPHLFQKRIFERHLWGTGWKRFTSVTWGPTTNGGIGRSLKLQGEVTRLPRDSMKVYQ